MATSDARNTAAAINAAAAAISSADPRYHAPERRRWKDSWARYWCFGSQKRDKRIVPTARGDGGTASGRGWAVADPAQAGLSLAPPSSPASFVNSSVHSPASFTLPLSAASASMCSPGPTNTMFTIGPYAHETQLVSPPAFFSTFTTEPSTAPFTPPPELAHLTTPSSPDVPFAQLIASTLGARTTAKGTFSPFSTSSLASPCDTPAGYIPSSRHLYLGSPVGHLISQTSGFLGSETTSGVPDIEFPAQFSASMGKRGSSFPTFEPFTTLTFDGSSSGALFQPDASNLEIRPALPFQEDGGMKLSSGVELSSGTDIQGNSQSMPMEDDDADHLSAAVVHKSDNEALVLSANKDERKSVRAKRFDNSHFNGLAESTRQVFCADAELKYWNSSGKNGYHSNMTSGASERENIGTSDMRQNAAVVKVCDKKGTDGGLSHPAETCPDLKGVDPILPVLQLYESSMEECYWTTSGKTHCSPR